MKIKIKEIEIDLKWWQIALVFAVIIIVLKLNSNELLIIAQQFIDKWFA